MCWSLWDLSVFEISELELTPSLPLLICWVLTGQTFLWTQGIKQKDLNSLLSPSHEGEERGVWFVCFSIDCWRKS